MAKAPAIGRGLRHGAGLSMDPPPLTSAPPAEAGGAGFQEIWKERYCRVPVKQA